MKRFFKALLRSLVPMPLDTGVIEGSEYNNTLYKLMLMYIQLAFERSSNKTIRILLVGDDTDQEILLYKLNYKFCEISYGTNLVYDTRKRIMDSSQPYSNEFNVNTKENATLRFKLHTIRAKGDKLDAQVWVEDKGTLSWLRTAFNRPIKILTIRFYVRHGF